MLGVRVTTVRKWLRLRRLPFHRIGGRVMLDEADLARFVEAGRVEAREETAR
jgi:excisionase family DNA binding protein